MSTMTLVERLRELGFSGNELGHEAADEIERLSRPKDYTAWLVEIGESSGPTYHRWGKECGWTPEHDTACHFGRRQDAESLIGHYGWERAKATEHVWPNMTASDVIARRRPATNAAAFPVPTTSLEKAQMKRPRAPR